jgi:hypothetical protein
VLCEAASLIAVGHERRATALEWHALTLPIALALILACRPSSWSWRAALPPALLVLTLPGVGVLALIGVVLPAWSRARRDAASNILDLDRQELITEGQTASTNPRVIRDVLAGNHSVAERLEAVLALRRLPARRAVPILRLAFSDPSEDVRLLAFADLERRESKLRARVKETRAELDACGDAAPEWQAHLQRCLAQAHWELVYGGFVQGTLEARVLQSAAAYAEASLERGPRGSAAVLLGRIALRQKRPEAAWRWLEEAERSGVSQAVCAPLFAEVAYVQRCFSSVAPLLGRASRAQLRRPGLAPVVDFWTGRDAS